MAYSKTLFDQLAKPHGDAGVEMLRRLNRVNEYINRMALEVLGECAGSDVLEIGFGGGALISDGLARFPHSKFHGAEVSELAVEQARAIFGNEIRENKVSLLHFDGGVLPFSDRAFDTVISVNVIYFVADVAAFLGELRRVSNSRGRCVLGYAERSPDRVTRFEKNCIEKALQSAGFSRTESRSARDAENGVFHCSIGYVQE